MIASLSPAVRLCPTLSAVGVIFEYVCSNAFPFHLIKLVSCFELGSLSVQPGANECDVATCHLAVRAWRHRLRLSRLGCTCCPRGQCVRRGSGHGPSCMPMCGNATRLPRTCHYTTCIRTSSARSARAKEAQSKCTANVLTVNTIALHRFAYYSVILDFIQDSAYMTDRAFNIYESFIQSIQFRKPFSKTVPFSVASN